MSYHAYVDNRVGNHAYVDNHVGNHVYVDNRVGNHVYVDNRVGTMCTYGYNHVCYHSTPISKLVRASYHARAQTHLFSSLLMFSFSFCREYSTALFTLRLAMIYSGDSMCVVDYTNL